MTSVQPQMRYTPKRSIVEERRRLNLMRAERGIKASDPIFQSHPGWHMDPESTEHRAFILEQDNRFRAAFAAAGRPDPILMEANEILAEIASQNGISVDDLHGPIRTHKYSVPRREACYRLRYEMGLSNRAIAEMLSISPKAVIDAIHRHKNALMERRLIERRKAAARIETAPTLDADGRMSVDDIIARTEREHGLFPGEIKGKRRSRFIVVARRIAIERVAREHPNWSLPKIGRAFGMDHTTILYALRKQRHGTAREAEE